MADVEPASSVPSEVAAQLTAVLGRDHVVTDAAARAVMGEDVYRVSAPPALIVRPQNIVQLQQLVRICAEHRIAMVPRGGGVSYTDGYLLAAGGHVLIDTRDLDAIAVDETNLTVTVGPGVTWARLRDHLRPLGLRTPFWGPFSGLAATVGGSVSQNSLSHGTAGFGISAESVLSIDVVLASGEILTTAASRATRFFGPDLTGLFTGDCGALGIKGSITLPLIGARSHHAALSFAFDDFASYHAAARLAQRERLEESQFGIDRALSQGQIGRQEGVGARIKIAADILRSDPSKLAAVRRLARLAAAGTGAMRAGEYMCHFIVEGCDRAEVAAKANRLRGLIRPHGREIANSVPTFVRGLPFAPLTNVLGPNGERWVPLHGILRHEDAVPFHEALAAFYAVRAADMARHGIWKGGMFSSVGSAGFLYEVALYWPDRREAYHDHMLDPGHLASIRDHPDNPGARAFIDQMKHDLVDLYRQFGAAHFQIGRAYPYRLRLDPAAADLLSSLKKRLDPLGLMNPGVLGI